LQILIFQQVIELIRGNDFAPVCLYSVLRALTHVLSDNFAAHAGRSF
jgi:hypothetical protein